MGAALLLYIASYAVNSLMGGYVPRNEMEPGWYTDYAHTCPNQYRWAPLIGDFSTLNRNAIGFIYRPLHVADCQLVHKTLIAPCISTSREAGEQGFKAIRWHPRQSPREPRPR